MKAIVINEYGGPEVLSYQDAENPVPSDSQVLIKVKAAALNPIDSKIRNGYMKQVMPIKLPFIPGWEASGIIVKTGKNVISLKAGDEVITRPSLQTGGSYAEYVAVDQNEVAIKPANLSFTDAAALPLVAGAAYTLLFKTANIQAGQKVFILGASGSVGLFAVQMAKLAGAHVTGTATGAGIDILKKAGADEIIDYKLINYADVIKNVDLALDLVGGADYEHLYTVVKKGGTLLSTTMQPLPEQAKAYDINASFVFTTPDKAVLDAIASMAGEGLIRPYVGKVLPLAKAAEAHRLMDEHGVSGKIILEI